MLKIAGLLFLLVILGCAGSQDDTVQVHPEGTLGPLAAGNISVVIPPPKHPQQFVRAADYTRFEEKRHRLEGMTDPTLTSGMQAAMRKELRRQGFSTPQAEGCLPPDAPLLCVTIVDVGTSLSSAVWETYTKHEMRAVWEVLDLSRGERLFQKSIKSDGKDSWGAALVDGLRKALESEDFPGNFSDFVAADRDFSIETSPTESTFEGFQEVYERYAPAVIVLKNGAGTAGGTGFVVGRGGMVLTNYHVVAAGDMQALLTDSTLVRANVICADAEYDVALLALEPGDYPCIPLSPVTDPGVAQEVYAIGAPLHEDLARTVTRGIISGIRRDGDRTWIQTDAPINPGNSGGPLLTEDGEVVGIVTWKVVGGDVEGIGFAVPITEALATLGLDVGGEQEE